MYVCIYVCIHMHAQDIHMHISETYMYTRVRAQVLIYQRGVTCSR